MKLSQWAKEQGIQYGTALKWFHNNTLPVKSEQLETGTILVYPNIHEDEKISTIIYARVSSYAKKQDLENQVKLCENFCIQNGWCVDSIFKEIASGMNDNRKKLNKILSMKNVRVVCLYKDRLTRFGFNYIDNIIKNNNGELVVINRDLVQEDDLMKDFIAVITSFCCRLYGARRGQSKALKIKNEINNDPI